MGRGRLSDSNIQNDADRREPRVEEEHAIPVVEEQLEIDKRRVEGKTVSVTSRVVNEDVVVREPVRREEVTVERVPVDRVVDAAPEVRQEGDLTVIPVVGERVKVTRELVLKEEIHLRRVSTDATQTKRVTLQKTEVVVDEGDESAG